MRDDHSIKWILTEDSPLMANLAALWAVDPSLAATLESLQVEPDDDTIYPIQFSKSGAPTLARPTSDGRQILLHSRHDPVNEAKLMVDVLPLVDRSAFFIHGLGLGYHAQSLFRAAGDDAIIAVFETDLRMILTAFSASDLSTLIASRRVFFFTRENDKADFFSRLLPHTATVSLGVERLIHAPSVSLNVNAHETFATWIAEFEAYTRTSMATLIVNGKRTAENIARNLPWYVANPGLSRLRNAYAKKPAIIVSAGPSLRKNKHLLKDAHGKAVMIAVQTTLQPMLELGVEPQFVTSLDYHDICTRFFEKLPKQLKTELVAEPKATDAIFDLNPGPLSLLGNDFADGLISEMKLDRPRLPSGATVAHLAFYLAEHLGCDPIIFVGQDLGFSDGLCYSPGTSYEDVWQPELSQFCTLEMKQWEQIVRDRNILRRVLDYAGRPTYTEERLFTYLQHFERDFARCKSRVIDATEGGVFKRGTQVMTLVEALDQHCTETFDISPPPHNGLDWARLTECEASLQNREREAGEIASISRETLPLLRTIVDHIDDQTVVNRTIGQIDSMRSRMHELARTFSLVMQMSQSSELQKFRADRRISAARVDGAEKQRRQVMRDIDNVESIVVAAVEFQTLMRHCVARVQEFSIEHGPLREAA